MDIRNIRYHIRYIGNILGIRNIGYQKYQISEILGIRNIRYLLISVLSYQSSIIEKMSELPVTNLHYFIRNKNPASYFLPDIRQVSFCRTPS